MNKLKESWGNNMTEEKKKAPSEMERKKKALENLIRVISATTASALTYLILEWLKQLLR